MENTSVTLATRLIGIACDYRHEKMHYIGEAHVALQVQNAHQAH